MKNGNWDFNFALNFLFYFIHFPTDMSEWLRNVQTFFQRAHNRVVSMSKASKIQRIYGEVLPNFLTFNCIGASFGTYQLRKLQPNRRFDTAYHVFFSAVSFCSVSRSINIKFFCKTRLDRLRGIQNFKPLVMNLFMAAPSSPKIQFNTYNISKQQNVKS